MGEVVVLDQVVVRVGQLAGVPDPIGLVLAEGGMIDVLAARCRRVGRFLPSRLGKVEVVGEVAVLHQPLAALFDLQADVPALGVEVLQGDVGDALGRDAHAFEVFRIALGGADDPCPVAVDGDVRGLDDDRSVGLRRIEHGIGGDYQRGRTRGGGAWAARWRPRRTRPRSRTRPTSARFQNATSGGTRRCNHGETLKVGRPCGSAINRGRSSGDFRGRTRAGWLLKGGW